MAKIYYRMIVELHKITLTEIPERWREEVRELLARSEKNV